MRSHARLGVDHGRGPRDKRGFPAIDHLSVAFLRWTLGIDEDPVGLDPSVAEAFPKANLTLESDLTP